MKKLSSGASIFLCIVIFLLIALIILFSAVSASASTTSIPISLVKNTSIPYSVGSLCSTSSNASYFISQPIPVEYGVTYILDYYSSYASFGLYFVGIDANGYVTESVKYAPGKVGSFTAEWTPSSSSTKSLMLRGYMSGYDQCAISSLSAIVFTDYYVFIDGGGGFTISQYWDSVDLTLIVNSDGYRIFASDYEEEYSYSESYNSVGYQFAGLTSSDSDLLEVDYAPGSRYNFTLDRTSPVLNLHSVFYTSSLTIDPNGGTWNYSSQPFIVWDFYGSDFDSIPAPIRPGYVFDGWTFTGAGAFDESDPNDPVYTFGDGHGVLTANWSVSPDAPKSTITIDGIPYVFTGTTEKPAVTLTVTSNGATLSYDSQSYTHVFSGTGTYSGLSFLSNGSATFSIGESYPLSAGDHTLYSCVAAPPTYILKAGQWECKSLIMTGEYIDLPAWPSDLGSVPFSFVSGGTSFSSMSVGTYLPTSQAQLLYGSSAAYRYPLGDLSGGFSNSAFAFVYLTSDQVVPKEFYDWFVSSFNRVSDSPVSPSFSTVVNLYDSSGLILYATYTISGSGTSPIATGTVLDNGVEFVDVSGSKWSWTLAPDPFLGFSFGNDSYAAVYPPGSTFEVGGVYSDFVLNLYLTQKPDDSQYQSAVLGFLKRIFDGLRPSSWLDLLDLVDFGFIGDIFSTAYHGLNGFFGLQNFVNDPAGPFGWLRG